jgi:hypothetical protein
LRPAILAGLVTREGPLGGPEGGGGVTPGGGRCSVPTLAAEKDAGKPDGAKGVITGAAEAGLESALVTGIIGGSYAVDVFILTKAGLGFVAALPTDGWNAGSAVSTGAGGVNTCACETIFAGGSYGENVRAGAFTWPCEGDAAIGRWYALKPLDWLAGLYAFLEVEGAVGAGLYGSYAAGAVGALFAAGA